jgi:glycosyltransferase involved in cell wall biosynthesis
MVNKPLLSVVICTYNRDNYLRQCLDHLAQQTALVELFEILVIDNRSTDGTRQVCDAFRDNHPEIQFNYCLEQNQGLSHCRNRGIEESNSELISYIDDDALADTDYVSNLITYFQHFPEVDAIGGKVTPIYQSDAPPWMSKYLLPLVAALDMGLSSKPFKGRKFPIGANMAFRRSVLLEIGTFSTDLGRVGSYLGSGEEKDMFYRMKKQQKRVDYVPNVHVFHSIPDNRLEIDYIKKMAQGIGKSEAIRTRQGSLWMGLGKWIEEFFKIGATAILALLYIIEGKWPKAKMLVKFRLWFLGSFLTG